MTERVTVFPFSERVAPWCKPLIWGIVKTTPELRAVKSLVVFSR